MMMNYDENVSGKAVITCPVFLDDDGNKRIDTLKLLTLKPSSFKIENVVLSSEELEIILNSFEGVVEVRYCLILGEGIKSFVSSPTDKNSKTIELNKIRKAIKDNKINRFDLMDI